MPTKKTRNKKLMTVVKELEKNLEVADYVLRTSAEKWDTKYVNSLPNAAFAVIEKGYSEGKDRRARHLPHHTKGVKSATEDSSVDLPHYRNALARVGQIKSVLGKDSDAALRKKAANHLKKHRAVLNKSKANFNEVEKKIWEECENLYNSNVVPILTNNKPQEG